MRVLVCNKHNIVERCNMSFLEIAKLVAERNINPCNIHSTHNHEVTIFLTADKSNASPYLVVTGGAYNDCMDLLVLCSRMNQDTSEQKMQYLASIWPQVKEVKLKEIKI